MTGARTLRGFTYRFEPAPSDPPARTLLLLHGTGGDEENLLPLGKAIDPVAALLSPRGKIDEHGQLRFFRRLREGVFDVPDLIEKTHDLAGFVEEACAAHGVDPAGLTAVGFSNGANIAASLLLLRPGLIRGAVLLSPMVPLEPEKLPDLRGTRVLIGAGRADPIAAPEQVERLARMLAESGAETRIAWHPGGHTLGVETVREVRRWLTEPGA